MLAERERVIDALYREIDELASREILLQAPVASDLRFLLSVVRIVPELERSHDLVVQIASRAGHGLSEELSRAAAGWSSGWGIWPGACGGRSGIPGGTATVLSLWRWASVMTR